MQAKDVMDIARAMAVADVDGLDPEDKFKLSLQEKFAVHEAIHRQSIADARDEFFMAVAKARRRLVVYAENNGERILVDVEKLYEAAHRIWGVSTRRSGRRLLFSARAMWCRGRLSAISPLHIGLRAPWTDAAFSSPQ